MVINMDTPVLLEPVLVSTLAMFLFVYSSVCSHS